MAPSFLLLVFAQFQCISHGLLFKHYDYKKPHSELNEVIHSYQLRIFSFNNVEAQARVYS